MIVRQLIAGYHLQHVLPFVLEQIEGQDEVPLPAETPPSRPSIDVEDIDAAREDWFYSEEGDDELPNLAPLPDDYLPAEVDKFFKEMESIITVASCQATVDHLLMKIDNRSRTALPALPTLVKSLKAQLEWERQRFDDFYQIAEALQAPDARDSGWTDALAVTCITRVVRTSALVPDATHAIDSLEDILRVLRLTVVRGYILTYGLGTVYGPKLAEHIFVTLFGDSKVPAFFLSKPTNTLPAATIALIEAKFPSFKDAILFTLNYVRRCTYVFGRLKPKGAMGLQDAKDAALGNWSKLDKQIGEFGLAPYSMFSGMGVSAPGTFRVPIRRFATSKPEKILDSLQLAFVDLLVLGTAMPALAEVEKSIPLAQGWKPSREKMMRHHPAAQEMGRVYLRGAVFSCITESLGEGFFIFDVAKDFVHGDSLLTTAFGTNIQDAIGVLQRTDNPLQSYGYAMEKLARVHPELVQLANEALEVVLQRFFMLGEPKRTSSSLPLMKDMTVEERRKHAFAAIGGLPPLLPNLDRADDLMLRSEDGVDVSILVLMVREALNAHRQLPEVLWEGRQILEGKNPVSTGSKGTNRQSDHFQPARRLWKSTKLLEKVIPMEDLVSPLGLTHMLNFFAYGHGEKTETFDEMAPTVCTSAEQLIQKYEMAIQSLIICFNTRVWGQPSKVFKFDESGPARLAAHYSIPPLYTALMGEANVNKHPSQWKRSTALTWREGYTFVKALRLPAFMSGLTVFHLANHLALRGIIEPATLDDIVSFLVDEGADKGALKHLFQCGFIVSNGANGRKGKASYKAVSQAISLIYEHFNEHLLEDEKADLGFNYDFVENMLCKGSRWVRAGRSVHGSDGTAPTKHGMQVGIWDMARGISDRIPLRIPQTKLEKFKVFTFSK